MRSHVGIASKMFRALSEEGINIQMITTSEIKTSVVIDEKYMELAVRALHKAFDLDQPAGLKRRAAAARIAPCRRSRDRVAEGAPLLREYVGKTCIEGSNPSGSAKPRLNEAPKGAFFIGESPRKAKELQHRAHIASALAHSASREDRILASEIAAFVTNTPAPRRSEHRPSRSESPPSQARGRPSTSANSIVTGRERKGPEIQR